VVDSCCSKIRSVNQSLNFAPVHSIKRMHDIAFVEYGQKAFHRAYGVAVARRDVLGKDASRILHSTQYRFLIGCTQAELLASRSREFKRKPADSFQPARCHGRLTFGVRVLVELCRHPWLETPNLAGPHTSEEN
jgi:hypothetical protein